MSIGIFDSGIGGENTLGYLRQMSDESDIYFFADKKNAPYGSKTEGELIPLVIADIERLLACGVDKILVACCTASYVCNLLPHSCTKHVLPIINAVADEAVRRSRMGKIGVISTDLTYKASAFRKSIARKCRKDVLELPTQELVAIVESGENDGCPSEYMLRTLKRVLRPLENSGIDTLILGCTHFSSIKKSISRMMPHVYTVDSAEVAAKLCKPYLRQEGGKTVYL